MSRASKNFLYGIIAGWAAGGIIYRFPLMPSIIFVIALLIYLHFAKTTKENYNGR